MAFLAKMATRGAARGLMKGDAGDFASIERAETIEKIKKKILENIELKKISIDSLDNKLLNKIGGEEGIKEYLKESKSLDVARSNLNPESNIKRDTVETNSYKSYNGTLDVSKSMYYNRTGEIQETKEQEIKLKRENKDNGISKEYQQDFLKDLDQDLWKVVNNFEGEIGKDFRKKEKNPENNINGSENDAEQKTDSSGKEGTKIDGEDGSSLESKFAHTKAKYSVKNHDKFIDNDINKIDDNQTKKDFDRSSNFNTPGNFSSLGNQRLNRNLAKQIAAARKASLQSGSFSQTSTGGQNLATGGGPKSGYPRRTGSYDPTRGQKSGSWIKNTFDPFRKGYDNTEALRDGLSSINDQAKQVNGPIDFLMEFAMRKAKESGVDVPDEGIANSNANNNNNNGMSSVNDIFMKKTENSNNKALEYNSSRSGLEYHGNSKTAMVEHHLAGKTAMVEHHLAGKTAMVEHHLAGKTAMVEHHLAGKTAMVEHHLVGKTAMVEHHPERKVEIGEHQIASKIAMIENRLEKKVEIEGNRLGRKAEIEERTIEKKAEIEENRLERKAEIEENRLERKAEIEENRLGKKAEIEENQLERKAEIEENRLGRKAEIEENRLERKVEIEENRLGRKAEIEENRLERKLEIEEYNPGLPKVEGKEHTPHTKTLEISKHEDTSQRNAKFFDQTRHNPLKEGDIAQQKESSESLQKNRDMSEAEKTKSEFIDSFDIKKLPEDVHEIARNIAEDAYKDAQKRNIDINKLKDEIQKQLENENFRNNFINVLRQERAMIEAEKSLDNSGKTKYKEQEVF